MGKIYFEIKELLSDDDNPEQPLPQIIRIEITTDDEVQILTDKYEKEFTDKKYRIAKHDHTHKEGKPCTISIIKEQL